MHAVSLLCMFIGLIILVAGIFKDGFPSSPKAKSATFITLGFLVTFGLAGAVTVSTQVPSIFAYIGLMLIISIPATVLSVASYKRTPYFSALVVIFVGAAIVGGSTFYVFGLVSPKTVQEQPASVQNTTNAKSKNISTSIPLANLKKVTILPGASAQGNPNFDPNSIKVNRSGGIQWTNKDNVPHTVTSLKDDGKTFDSSLIKAGSTYSLSAQSLSPGDYGYFCTLHPYMRGLITITGS